MITAPALELNGKSDVIRVLDVGCGFGDSLNEEFQLRREGLESPPHIEMVGVDIDEQRLAVAKANYPNFVFLCAQGEKLPFPDESFDTVISRVAILYMDIPVALREMRRVLKIGGELRIKLHPLSFTLAELAAELRSGSLLSKIKNLIYRLYVLANGAVFHLTGNNFRFPLARHRCESFQTQSGMRRALLAAGFDQVNVSCWENRSKWPNAGNCRASARRSS